MKITTGMSRLNFGVLIATGIFMTIANGSLAQAPKPKPETNEMVGRLSCYPVKPARQESFRRALADYVQKALAEKGNLQAETYFERENQSVLWLIERWENRPELDRFGGSLPAKAIDLLKPEALATNAQIYHVTDLEPLSKQQWRRAASAEDHPLTVMLFVDAREGTQHEFKTTYRVALPQFRSEPGVVTYQLSQVLGDETKFVTFEKFRSDAAFQYHLNFPPIKPVIDYLQTSIKKQPFQSGLHTLIEFAPMTRE